jgi:acyl homoserine lactone synthase
METALASYRHSVFIEELGWQLPCTNGLERDDFDRDDTVHVVAQDEEGRICGCARLLPTTKTYLLGAVFPELMNGLPIPCSASVWELSRFSTRPAQNGETATRAVQRERFCVLFRSLTRAAIERGAERLITFTAMGMERVLRQIGIHAHRVGPPQLIDGKPVLALWIELDDQTRAALDA